jgi:hypothetical protein
MAADRGTATDPQAVRSHARGPGFRLALIAVWPASVLVGVIGSLIFGGGIAVGVASGLALALGLSFVWVVLLLAMDHGAVDDRVRETVTHRPALDARPAPHTTEE